MNRRKELLDAEGDRRLGLFVVVIGLIYHEGEASEFESLRELILGSLRTDECRREVQEIMRTMADVLREEGMEQGRREEAVRSRQEILLRLLRARFKKVPRAVGRTIKAADDIARLDAWIEHLATADTLDEVGIGNEP